MGVISAVLNRGACNSTELVGPTLAPQANARLGERIALFETIYRTLEWGYSNENLLYATSVLHHLLASFRFVHQFRGRRDQSARTDIVDTALLFMFMQENIEKKLSVSELASYVGYSVSPSDRVVPGPNQADPDRRFQPVQDPAGLSASGFDRHEDQPDLP